MKWPAAPRGYFPLQQPEECHQRVPRAGPYLWGAFCSRRGPSPALFLLSIRDRKGSQTQAAGRTAGTEDLRRERKDAPAPGSGHEQRSLGKGRRELCCLSHAAGVCAGTGSPQGPKAPRSLALPGCFLVGFSCPGEDSVTARPWEPLPAGTPHFAFVTLRHPQAAQSPRDGTFCLLTWK